MITEEMVKRSPLRLLERTTHGGIKKGSIGVLAGPKGIGKTACLVHIATDQLLQKKHVIHVSFAPNPDHIVSWYEDIFSEVAKKYNLDCAMEVHDDIIKNRVIMNFRQDDLPVERIEKSIAALSEKGNFEGDVLVVDGYDFVHGSPEQLQELRRFAESNNFTVWMSMSSGIEAQLDSIPEILNPYQDQIEVIIGLKPRGDHVRLYLLKDHDEKPVPDMHLSLDSSTFLIV